MSRSQAEILADAQRIFGKRVVVVGYYCYKNGCVYYFNADDHWLMVFRFYSKESGFVEQYIHVPIREQRDIKRAVTAWNKHARDHVRIKI